MNKSKTYFGYIRVSTVKQGVHGVSLQEQKSAIEAYAARSGHQVVAWFEEQETAAKQGRRIFTQMIRQLEKGHADGVIMHKIDRGARNPHDWISLGMLVDRGLEVHFAHDALDMNSRGGRLAADIQAVVAADFIRNLRDETRKGFYGRLKQGIYPLRAPIGYLDKGKGNTKEIDPVQGPIVRQTFELYATAEYSFKRLQPVLFNRGLRNKNGGPVSRNGLTTILNNPFYVGLIHIRKTNELFEGRHTPLVSKALYDEVQIILRGESRRGPNKQTFLFCRLFRCAQCGRRLVGERIKDRYIYYRCHTDGCNNVCIPERAIDTAIRAKLEPLQFSSRELMDFGDVVKNERMPLQTERAQNEAATNLLIARCNEKLARLTDALIEALIDKETFDSRKAAVLEEKRALLDRLTEIASEPSIFDWACKIVQQANMAYLQYENGNLAEKRETVRLLFSNSVVAGKKPVITLQSPFRGIYDVRKSTECDLHRDQSRTFAAAILDALKRAANFSGCDDKTSVVTSPTSLRPQTRAWRLGVPDGCQELKPSGQDEPPSTSRAA